MREDDCRKVDMKDLKQLSLERSDCKVNLWLTSENLGFRRVPTIPRNFKSGSLCLNHVNNVVYAECLISFWESGTFVYARQREAI